MQKVVWIIGASTGIGKAVAEELASQNYTIALSARTKDALELVLKQLKNVQQHSAHPCDVSRLETLEQAYKEILKQHHTIDIIIFAAGIYTPMPLDNFDLKVSLKTLDVNLSGAFNLFEVIKDRALSKQSKLHLVWLASVAGYRGLPRSCAYGVSKSGLISFAEIQKSELQSRNTKVQVVNPGFVKTRLTDKNKFEMPMLISPQKAAKYIAKGLNSKKFNISFPPLFSFVMKLLLIMPDALYFWIARKLAKGQEG